MSIIRPRKHDLQHHPIAHLVLHHRSQKITFPRLSWTPLQYLTMSLLLMEVLLAQLLKGPNPPTTWSLELKLRTSSVAPLPPLLLPSSSLLSTLFTTPLLPSPFYARRFSSAVALPSSSLLSALFTLSSPHPLVLRRLLASSQ
ncbi:hypothetical protein L6452_37332 [Arctium lappa]|uniref:Uncharacterized protein n=1 Tax=Arctium lappa TaxID=4217 RepID=A0ACB8Y365_ARCLA|nr:hypothetical protein L6452_37332 [Arctium lappa]